MYCIIVLYNCIVICIVRTIEYQSLVQCLCLQKDKGREIEREIESNIEGYKKDKDREIEREIESNIACEFDMLDGKARMPERSIIYPL